MRYCRFELQGQTRYGRVALHEGRDYITHLLLAAPEHAGSILDTPSEAVSPIPLSEVRLLAPVRPSKIVCLGRNYRAHAVEMGNEVPKEPLIFFKPPSSVLGTGENILLPKLSELVHFEGELAIVIGKTCYHLAEAENVQPYILGYTALNDVTARDLQKKDNQWARAKGFDTFCPVAPIVSDEIDPWKGVRVETRVNGELRQQGTTLDLLFPIDTIIHYISSVMTLYPGDLIATGTPEGVGPLVGGDVVEVYVEGVGSVKNPVVRGKPL